MKLFLAGTSLRPAYGGPAYSVSRLAIALTEVGVQVGLWAPDQSAATTELLPAESSVQRLTGTESEALESFGDRHAETFRMGGKHKEVRGKQRRPLRLALEWTEERNDLV